MIALTLFILLSLAYILACGYGEAVRLHDQYDIMAEKEHKKLQVLWHNIGWVRHALPLFIGWVGYTAAAGNIWLYFTMLLLVGSIWWFFYDGIINTIRVPIRPWFYISQETGSQLDKYGWIPKLVFFVASLVVLSTVFH